MYTTRKILYYNNYLYYKMEEEKETVTKGKKHVFDGKRQNFSDNTFRNSYLMS